MDRQIGRDVGQSIAFEFKNVPLHAFCCFATWKHRWSLVGILIHPGDSLNLLNQLKDLFTDFRKWHRYSSRWRSLSACLFVCYKRVFNLLKPIRKKKTSHLQPTRIIIRYSFMFANKLRDLGKKGVSYAFPQQLNSSAFFVLL